jgi:hypothetical protein
MLSTLHLLASIIQHHQSLIHRPLCKLVELFVPVYSFKAEQNFDLAETSNAEK